MRSELRLGAHLSGRDHSVLLGRPALLRHSAEPPATSRRRATTPTSRNKRYRRRSSPLTTTRRSPCRRPSAGLGAGRKEVPPAGRDRADVRLEHETGRHHYSLDGFTAQKTYPGAKTLYWRVQAHDENNNGLTWSETRTFEVDLEQPTLDPARPTLGDASLPVLRWFPVPGAVSYSLRIHEPNDTTPNTYSGYPSTAASFEKITGTGLFTWEIRADFPKLTGGTTPGPWSDDADYTHTIKEPTGPVSSAGANRLVLSWNAKTGTKAYKVQISNREDFNPSFETKTTDNPDWAPSLTNSNYAAGGDFWWRVAAIDGDGNVGAFATNPEHFTLPAMSGGGGGGGPKEFKVTFTGRLVKNRAHDITVKVRDSVTSNVLQGALVRAYGSGVSLTQKTTNSSGVVKFRLKPTQLQKVSFRITKSGYTSVTMYRRVFRP